MHVDHVGVATRDATGLAERFATLLDAEIAHTETFDEMGVVFLDLDGTYVEFLEPLSESGPIADRLSAAGPGLHHLALETPDVEAALERARQQDVECIDEEPRPGAWGHEVAFLHPKDTGGVLLEFVEH